MWGGCTAIPCRISRVDIAYASWQIFQPCRTFQVNSFMHMKKLQKEQPAQGSIDFIEETASESYHKLIQLQNLDQTSTSKYRPNFSLKILTEIQLQNADQTFASKS